MAEPYFGDGWPLGLFGLQRPRPSIGKPYRLLYQQAQDELSRLRADKQAALDALDRATTSLAEMTAEAARVQEELDMALGREGVYRSVLADIRGRCGTLDAAIRLSKQALALNPDPAAASRDARLVRAGAQRLVKLVALKYGEAFAPFVREVFEETTWEALQPGIEVELAKGDSAGPAVLRSQVAALVAHCLIDVGNAHDDGTHKECGAMCCEGDDCPAVNAASAAQAHDAAVAAKERESIRCIAAQVGSECRLGVRVLTGAQAADWIEAAIRSRANREDGVLGKGHST